MAESEMKIVFRVERTRDLERANKTLAETGHFSKKLENRFDALGASQLRSVQATKKVEVQKKALNKQLEAGVISQQRYDRAVEEAIRQAEEYIIKDQKLIQRNKEKIKAQENAAKAAAKEAAELEKLKQKYDPLYAAGQRMKQAQIELQKVFGDSWRSTELGSRAFKALESDYKQFEAAVKSGGVVNAANQFARFGDSAYNAQQRVKRFASVGLQQAGYQVGDFIVQIQSGQNALVALGQQGSQLLGIFGTKGALYGALLAAATAVAMIAVEAYRTSKGIKTVEEAFKDLQEAIQVATSNMDLSQTSLEEMQFTYGALGETILRNAQKLNEVNLQNAITKFGALAETLERVDDPRWWQKALSFMAVTGGASVVPSVPANPNIAQDIQDDFEQQNFQDLGFQVGQDYFEAIMDGIKAASQLSGEEAFAALEAELAKLREMIAQRDRTVTLNEDQQNTLDAIVNSYEQLLTLIEGSNAEEAERARLVKRTSDAIAKNVEQAEQELEIQRNIIAFGEDSVQVQAAKERHIRANLTAQYQEMVGAQGLTDAQKQALEVLIDHEIQISRNELAIEANTQAARELERAYEDIAKVINGISEENIKLQSDIQGQVAQLFALRDRNPNASIEGNLARDLAALEAARQADLSKVEEANIPEGDRLNRLEEINTLYGEQARLLERSAQLSRQIAAEEAQIQEEKKAAAEAEKLAEKRAGLEKELALYKEELRLRENVLRVGDREARQALELFEAKQELGEMAILMTDQEILALTRKYDLIEQREKQAQELRQAAQQAIESNIMAMVTGNKSATEAFKAMAAQIITEIYRIIFIKKLAASISMMMFESGGAFMNGRVLPNKNGNPFYKGNVIPFASGGVVASPTFFPMAGGKTGLMGEAGPEAVMPLKRGKDGKLGVASSGSTVNVTNNITVEGNSSPQQVRQEVISLFPEITRATTAAVFDARRRGQL